MAAEDCSDLGPRDGPRGGNGQGVGTSLQSGGFTQYSTEAIQSCRRQQRDQHLLRSDFLKVRRGNQNDRNHSGEPNARTYELVAALVPQDSQHYG
jgi:hypothetical protein